MSEAASVGELESIAQAIALADGFQLLVLECEPLPPGGLQRLLDEVQRRVAELRGEPSSIRIYSPRSFTAWIADVRVQRRLGEAGDVTLIDGTEPAGGRRGESNWHFLFQRLNERRNAIARKHAGTMILALAPALSRMFLEEAPDMASIRSGMFHIDAKLLQADREPAIAPATRNAQELHIRREGGANERLRELLLDLFRTSELYQFVHYNFPDVAPLLPESSSPSDLALAVVDRLGALGRIDRRLFERLARERPERTDEIYEVAMAWGMPPAKRGTNFAVPSDLHERLLELNPAQLEQVMYLAGIAGDDSANKARALRERPSTSAREIFARARSEGPEALARLADAIDLVTARE